MERKIADLKHRERIDYVVEVLENCKFDLGYRDRLEGIGDGDHIDEYFQQSVDRIDSAIKVLTVMKHINEPKPKKSIWSSLREMIWK